MATSKPNTIIPRNESLRVRTHRFTALPVKDVLKIRMKDLGITNQVLQKALGYPMPNVIAMMKTGSMRLPASKAVVAAELLEIDPTFLLSKVIAENDPALWDAISAVMGDHLVTAKEMALLNLVRQGLDGHDVDLIQSPGLTQAITPHLENIVERENALAQAVISRDDK